MTAHQPDFPHFTAMLKEVLGDLVDQRAEGFVDLMADDGVMEFPYAPPHLASRLEGRAAVAAHMRAVTELFTLDEISVARVHHAREPGVVVIEFSGEGRGKASGRPYRQCYISVITARAGRIVHYRDYWNPLAVSAAFDPADAVPASNEAT